MVPNSSSDREAAVIRVMVVDDHFVARRGVDQLAQLQADLDVVGQAASGLKALELYREIRPDVVIIDLNMPVFDGAQTTAALMRRWPDARVLCLSSYDTESDVFRVQAAGAIGFVPKRAAPEELLAAIRAVARGERTMPRSLIATDVRRRMRLNARDLQLLKMMAEGLDHKNIALQTGLTRQTVKTYAKRLFAKMGVHKGAEAVFEATRLGLIPASIRLPAAD